MVLQVAEQHDQDREADRRLGRRDGQDEEHEHLPGEVAEEVRERDEVEVDREQHQLDRHQQHDHVLAVEEDADHADREQDRRPAPGRCYSANHGRRVSARHLTSRTRSSRARPRPARADVLRAWSLRWRRVSAIAAMIATSRITAAISNG